MTVVIPTHVSAQSCGYTVARLLRELKTFKVLALFERSVYLQACRAIEPTIAGTVETPTENKQSQQHASDYQKRPGILCINDSRLGQGPLQLEIRSQGLQTSTGLFNGTLKPGARVLNDIANCTLLLPAGNSIDYRNALQVCAVSESGSLPETLISMSADVLRDDACTSYLLELATVLFTTSKTHGRQSSEHLFAATMQWLSDRSINCLVLGDPFISRSDSATSGKPWRSNLNACCADIEKLHASMVEDTSTNKQLDGLGSMIGAGNGLTPAGDDFVCGVLVALRLYGMTDSIEHIRELLHSGGLNRTNTISAAHMCEVVAGRLSERSLVMVERSFELLRVLRASGPGHKLQVTRAASKLSAACDAIGASSGWDFLAGLISTLVILHPGARRQPVLAHPFLTSCSIDGTSMYGHSE